MTELIIEHEGSTYTVANPNYCNEDHATIISIGVYGSIQVIVFIENDIGFCDLMLVLEEALDHVPTEYWDCSETVGDLFREGIRDGLSTEKAYAQSISDVTLINGGSNHIAEWQTGTVSEVLLKQAKKESELFEEIDA